MLRQAPCLQQLADLGHLGRYSMCGSSTLGGGWFSAEACMVPLAGLCTIPSICIFSVARQGAHRFPAHCHSESVHGVWLSYLISFWQPQCACAGFVPMAGMCMCEEQYEPSQLHAQAFHPLVHTTLGGIPTLPVAIVTHGGRVGGSSTVLSSSTPPHCVATGRARGGCV